LKKKRTEKSVWFKYAENKGLNPHKSAWSDYAEKGKKSENENKTLPQVRFCRKCGSEISPKSRFCERCGKRI
jgi:hypothetical protein